ncbi:PREDICTED: probable pectinesterase 66 [Tarenaya hassleriana]|uniref:probable pectinesterase 66 n=1 Tax=Tarenaya hassleriana TaxID=28532 RepID=UPI00053C5C76|nr:PREDICTED: probable pectinesterase 66 [Tarenaya hassleriana]
MQFPKPQVLHNVIMIVTLWVCGSMALECQLNESGNPIKVAYTVLVDPNGPGNFRTVQQAVDSIPTPNSKWIRILIRSGVYQEKVVIPKTKPCIFLQGGGIDKTVIEYGDHEQTDTSATFSAFSDDIMAKDITFKNFFNVPRSDELLESPALAVRLYGDRYSFVNCSFEGLQDTIWDVMGRHYYKNCLIAGGIDFIWGSGQSLFEGCTLNVTLGWYAPERDHGAITAQGRMTESDPGGFVFKGCTVTGKGKVLLGRAYGPYSRVIFHQSQLSDIVLPVGWDSWSFKGSESKMTYMESECTGVGARREGRVPWLKSAASNDVANFTSLSYIDPDGWLSRRPIPISP